MINSWSTLRRSLRRATTPTLRRGRRSRPRRRSWRQEFRWVVKHEQGSAKRNKFGNDWVSAQLICRPTRAKKQLYKSPNIVFLVPFCTPLNIKWGLLWLPLVKRASFTRPFREKYALQSIRNLTRHSGGSFLAAARTALHRLENCYSLSPLLVSPVTGETRQAAAARNEPPECLNLTKLTI